MQQLSKELAMQLAAGRRLMLPFEACPLVQEVGIFCGKSVCLNGHKYCATRILLVRNLCRCSSMQIGNMYTPCMLMPLQAQHTTADPAARTCWSQTHLLCHITESFQS
jgi:hypothetical protein